VVHLHDENAGLFLFEFQTAWSFPRPIFEALVKKYPTLTFTTASFDEGWIFASEGAFGATATLYDEFEPAKNKERAREVHNKVYGKFPEEDNDESED
jgi:hypothetical protein